MNGLEWKYVKGYNDKYCITKDGRVFIVNHRGTGKPKEMRPRVIAGYLALGLEAPDSNSKNRKQKIHKIHRLVAEAFIPNVDNKPCVNHIDGNKLNNNVSNLEWCTVQENTQHACRNKLERNWWTNELGLVCINLIENYKYNFADVAKLFGLPSRARVYWFWNFGYKTFGLIHNNPFIPKHSNKKELPESYKQYIFSLIKDNTVLNSKLKGAVSVTSSR